MFSKRNRVFLSYRHTDRDLANVVAQELERCSFRIWSDWTSKLSLRRRWATRANGRTEQALDTWLRNGALRSDIVVALVSQNFFFGGFPIHDGDQGQPFVHLLTRERDPRKIYRDASVMYYLGNRRRLWQNEWYSWFMNFRIGKDRLETWQQWEMRVGQAMGARTLMAVLGDSGDPAENLQDLITRGIENTSVDAIHYKDISFDNICLLRRDNLSADLADNLMPALRKIAEPGRTRQARTSRRRYRIARTLSPFAVPVVIAYLFLGLVVLDIVDLFRKSKH